MWCPVVTIKPTQREAMINKTCSEKYPYALWHTENGGIVRQHGTDFVFVFPPEEYPDIKEGDTMDITWQIEPANERAISQRYGPFRTEELEAA